MKRVLILSILPLSFLVLVFFSIHQVIDVNRSSVQESTSGANGVHLANTGRGSFKAAPTPTAAPRSAKDDDILEQAILQATQSRQKDVLGFLLYQVMVDNFRYSEDGQWSAAWLGLWDEELMAPLPGEPGLVLARRRGEQWEVVLPSDAGWLEALKDAPEDLISTEEKETWTFTYQKRIDEMPKAPLSGYLLPWPKGQARYLSRSVGHDASFTSGNYHFSFDFYLPNQQWPVYASKGGTVWKYKVDVPTCYEYNCGQNMGNYIVIQDFTTNPVTYMVYLHFAYDSIPASLRTIGAPVLQGQLIGIANNTGMSWGNHLHYQVHTNTDYYGVALDITFDDVGINGGRPRVSPADPSYCRIDDVCDTFQSTYISNNTVRGDLYPPTAEMVSPVLGQTVSSSSLLLAATASDIGSGLHTARFVVYYDNLWRDVGPVFTSSPAIYEWDMCAARVPDGPVSAAMRLQDRDGNIVTLGGLTHFTKNYACSPPPPCVPAAEQVALYENPGYTGCQLFTVGDYPGSAAIAGVGADDTESLQVGANVQATLYLNEGFQGRGQTFIQNDANLSDNLIGSNTVSSLQVWPYSRRPLTPTLSASLDLPLIPAANDVITLVWENGGGAREYQVRLARLGDTSPITTVWVPNPFYHFVALQQGDYEYQVRARNQAGDGPWSPVRTFRVAAPNTVTSTPLPPPYVDNLEADTTSTRWTTRGAWSLKTVSTLAHEGSNSFWYQGSGGDYDNGKRNYGDLTSPSINIPTTGYYLRFWSRNETEGSGPYWDQRWVQISQNGGPFVNVYQITDDPRQFWVQSPYIDLSAYAGSAIQVRFRFDTIDPHFNAFPGWGIDDISITVEPVPVCSAYYEPNNTPAQAISLSYGMTISGAICPPGDIDYYRFEGSAGDRVVVDIDAFSISSNLDPVLYLLDSDGGSVLAEHDDEIYSVMLDPHLGYQLPRDGVYYLKLVAWDHPKTGGTTYFYDLHLSKDDVDPQVSISFPNSGVYLPAAPFDIVADAADAHSGIQKVDFFVHTGNWHSTNWTKLGADTDGSDGWQWTFNPAAYIDQKGMAFYAVAYDWANNTLGAGAYGLGIDRTPPNTAILPLAASQTSTAFKVEWTGTDTASGIARFDLQWNVNGTGWVDLAPGLIPSLNHYWVVGQADRTYAFRMRGVDLSGNTEAYPAAAETTTAIPVPSVFCSAPDLFEADNTSGTASRLSAFGPGDSHNLCNPLAADRLNDVDWISMDLQAGVTYHMLALPSQNTGLTFTLLSAGGDTPLKQTQAESLGSATRLTWIAGESGRVYLKIQHIDGRVAGNSASYKLYVFNQKPVFLPLVHR